MTAKAALRLSSCQLQEGARFVNEAGRVAISQQNRGDRETASSGCGSISQLSLCHCVDLELVLNKGMFTSFLPGACAA